MKPRSILWLLTGLHIVFSINVISANIHTFESDVGIVEIDIPYIVERGNFSSGNSLLLVKPGTSKPIIRIDIIDSALFGIILYFDDRSFGPHLYGEMITNASKTMLFNSIQDGYESGEPTYTFRAYIDYSPESGKCVIISAQNIVIYQGEIIAAFTKDQFVSICKSFCF